MKSVIGNWAKGATYGVEARRSIDEGGAKCTILVQAVLKLAFPSHGIQKEEY